MVGFFGAFANFIGVSNSIIAELIGAMLAIEFVHDKGRNKIWLESDSLAEIRVFSPPFQVPWKICTRWINCINIAKNISFVASHIFRERNNCAGSLTNIGVVPQNLPSQFSRHLSQ